MNLKNNNDLIFIIQVIKIIKKPILFKTHIEKMKILQI